jgi:hypothetical protein
MKTYHEVAQPILLLRHVRAAMQPGARLAIIDRNGRGDDHGVNRDVVIGEVQRAGFVLAADYDFVKPDGADYFLIFEPSLRGPLKRTLQNSFRSQERFSGSGCYASGVVETFRKALSDAAWNRFLNRLQVRLIWPKLQLPQALEQTFRNAICEH